MYLIIVYFFVFYIEGVDLKPPWRRRALDSAAETAKLIDLVNKINSFQRVFPKFNDIERQNKETEAVDPEMFEAIELLRRSNVNSRKYYEAVDPVNIQHISNPGVLDIYKNLHGEQVAMYADSQEPPKLPQSYIQELQEIERLPMHLFGRSRRISHYRSTKDAMGNHKMEHKRADDSYDTDDFDDSFDIDNILYNDESDDTDNTDDSDNYDESEDTAETPGPKYVNTGSNVTNGTNNLDSDDTEDYNGFDDSDNPEDFEDDDDFDFERRRNIGKDKLRKHRSQEKKGINKLQQHLVGHSKRIRSPKKLYSSEADSTETASSENTSEDKNHDNRRNVGEVQLLEDIETSREISKEDKEMTLKSTETLDLVKPIVEQMLTEYKLNASFEKDVAAKNELDLKVFVKKPKAKNTNSESETYKIDIDAYRSEENVSSIENSEIDSNQSKLFLSKNTKDTQNVLSVKKDLQISLENTKEKLGQNHSSNEEVSEKDDTDVTNDNSFSSKKEVFNPTIIIDDNTEYVSEEKLTNSDKTNVKLQTSSSKEKWSKKLHKSKEYKGSDSVEIETEKVTPPTTIESNKAENKQQFTSEKVESNAYVKDTVIHWSDYDEKTKNKIPKPKSKEKNKSRKKQATSDRVDNEYGKNNDSGDKTKISTKRKTDDYWDEKLESKKKVDSRISKNNWNIKQYNSNEKYGSSDKTDNRKKKDNLANRNEKDYTQDKKDDRVKNNWNKKDDSSDRNDDRWNKDDDSLNKKNNREIKNNGYENDDSWEKQNDRKKKNNWNEKDDSWDKKDDRKKKDNRQEKNEYWDKNDSTWSKKDDGQEKKDDRKKTDGWNEKGDRWDKNDEIKKINNWNENVESWDKKDKGNNGENWNKKDTHNNKYKNWDNKDDRNKKYSISDNEKNRKDNWNTKDNTWGKRKDGVEKDDKWDKKDKNYDSWEKRDNWDKITKHNSDKDDDSWNKQSNENKEKKRNENKDEWDRDEQYEKNKKNERNKQGNFKLKTTPRTRGVPKRDSAWDKVGIDSNKNLEWGNYESFKNLQDKKNSNERETTKEKKRIVPTVDVPTEKYKSWENERPKRVEHKEPLRSQGRGLIRTPIPFVGNKAIYD